MFGFLCLIEGHRSTALLYISVCLCNKLQNPVCTYYCAVMVSARPRLTHLDLSLTTRHTQQPAKGLKKDTLYIIAQTIIGVDYISYILYT